MNEDIRNTLNQFSKENFQKIDKSFDDLTTMLEDLTPNGSDQVYCAACTIQEYFKGIWQDFDKVRENPTHDSLYAISRDRFIGISNLLALLRDQVDVLRSKEIRGYIEKLEVYFGDTGLALDKIAEGMA